MISIVTCSTKPDLLAAFSKNIEDTIGVPYELISIDNRENKYSIFQAYNIGLAKAKYPLLVFVHQDILFETSNWGKILEQYFAINESLGLIGIAGSQNLSRVPALWHANGSEFNFARIKHQYNGGGDITVHDDGWDYDEHCKKVVAVDGVFMAYRKKVNIIFNEHLKGFHFYDLSFSIDIILQHWDILVIRDIDIVHMSVGNVDNKWLNASMNFGDLYVKELPISINTILKDKIAAIELKNLRNNMYLGYLFGNYKVIFYYWKLLWKFYPFRIKYHVKAVEYILRYLLKFN